MKRLFIPLPATIANSHGTAKQGVACSRLQDSGARGIEKVQKRKKKREETGSESLKQAKQGEKLWLRSVTDNN